jgi:hypothetical protein
MKRRFRAEKERLRLAFKTEIQQLNISDLRILIEELDSSEGPEGAIDADLAHNAGIRPANSHLGMPVCDGR